MVGIRLIKIDISILEPILMEKAELTTSAYHIGRFLKTGIPIYNSEVQYTARRKTKRTGRTQTIA